MRGLNIVVSAPCKMSWDDMEGDERVRHCNGCSQNVYNVSAMTQREAESFLQTNGANKCMQFYRRADGKILTDNCPVGLRAVRKKCRAALRVLAAGVASLLAIFPFLKSNSQQQDSSSVAGATAVDRKLAKPEGSPMEAKDKGQNERQLKGKSVSLTPSVGGRVGSFTTLGYVHRIPEEKRPAKQVMVEGECSDVPSSAAATAANKGSLSDNPSPADFAAHDLYSKARASEEQHKAILALLYMRQAYTAWKEQKGADPAFGAHIQAEILRLELK